MVQKNLKNEKNINLKTNGSVYFRRKSGIFEWGVTLVAYTFDSTGGLTDYTPDVVAGVSANSLNDVDTAGTIPASNGTAFTFFFTAPNAGSTLLNHAIALENGGLATGTAANLADAWWEIDRQECFILK